MKIENNIYIQLLSKINNEDNYEIDFKNGIENIDTDQLNKLKEIGFLYSQPLIFNDLNVGFKGSIFNENTINQELMNEFNLLMTQKITKKELNDFINKHGIKFDINFIIKIKELFNDENIDLGELTKNNNFSLLLIDFNQNSIYYGKSLIFLIELMIENLKEKGEELKDFINDL